MTDHAPLDQPIVEILQAYNPLEIKDILLNGARRKAINHKTWDAVLGYYQENCDYMHHYLLDSPEAFNHYAMCQKAYITTYLTQSLSSVRCTYYVRPHTTTRRRQKMTNTIS